MNGGVSVVDSTRGCDPLRMSSNLIPHPNMAGRLTGRTAVFEAANERSTRSLPTKTFGV